MKKTRKVLIGTPSYDGRIDVWFADSLVNTIKESFNTEIEFYPIYMSYDSLVQRARNSIFHLAVTQGYDDLLFLDSDIEWEPEWIYRLLSRPEPVVGAALVKKGDEENYTVKLVDKKLKYSSDKKLIEVDGVGTGFLKISRFALEKIWESETQEYEQKGNTNKMIFDIKVENGDLISEDYIFCEKWKALGYKVWLDPTITCNHIGVKKYKGNFNKFIDKLGYE